MSRSIRLAIAGATGQVGTALLEQLANEALDFSALHLLASEQSAGKRLPCNGRHYAVESLDGFDFTCCDVVLFATPPMVSARLAPLAVNAGCHVLDLSGHFLTDLTVPLALGEVIDARLPTEGGSLHSLPGTISQLLAPLLVRMVDEEMLVAANITALLPASMAGSAGVDELAAQTTALLNVTEPPTGIFPERLAFQLQAAGQQAQGSSHNALGQSAVLSLKRLLGLDMEVDCQALFVPVFHGTTLAVNLECRDSLAPGQLEHWVEQAGFDVLPEQERALSRVLCRIGEAAVSVQVTPNPARASHKASLLLSSDNVYRAAALALETLQCLIRH